MPICKGDRAAEAICNVDRVAVHMAVEPAPICKADRAALPICKEDRDVAAAFVRAIGALPVAISEPQIPICLCYELRLCLSAKATGRGGACP